MQLNVLVVGCQSSLLSSTYYTRTSPPCNTCTEGALSTGEGGKPPGWLLGCGYCNDEDDCTTSALFQPYILTETLSQKTLCLQRTTFSKSQASEEIG